MIFCRRKRFVLFLIHRIESMKNVVEKTFRNRKNSIVRYKIFTWDIEINNDNYLIQIIVLWNCKLDTSTVCSSAGKYATSNLPHAHIEHLNKRLIVANIGNKKIRRGSVFIVYYYDLSFRYVLYRIPLLFLQGLDKRPDPEACSVIVDFWASVSDDPNVMFYYTSR